MAVKVLITRRFKKGALVDLMVSLSRLRGAAMDQAGYITGETLLSKDDPQKLVVISTWDTEQDWVNWRDSQTRKEVEAGLEPHLLEAPWQEVFSMAASRRES